MITKLDNPSKTGFQYLNTGSVARLKNYLVANEEKLNTGDLFFDAGKDNIGEEQFYKMIDNNVKGLAAREHKFYSFTINPSDKELAFIGNDYNKFKEYVREAMKTTYPAAFAEKKGVKPEDLVWGGIIHEKRFYSKDEYEKQKDLLKKEPAFRPGDAKPNSMHAHIIVSARNKSQSKTLSVLTPTNKLSRDFNLKHLQRANEKLFQEKFFYQQGVNLYETKQRNLINEKIAVLARYQRVDPEKIQAIAKAMDYSPKFDRHLGQLIGTAKRGQAVADLDLFFEKGSYKARKENPEIFIKSSFDGPTMAKAAQTTVNRLEAIAYVISETPTVQVRQDRPHPKKKRKKLLRKGQGPGSSQQIQ